MEIECLNFLFDLQTEEQKEQTQQEQNFSLRIYMLHEADAEEEIWYPVGHSAWLAGVM